MQLSSLCYALSGVCGDLVQKMIYLVASFFQGRLCISVVGIYNSQRASWDLVYMGKPVWSTQGCEHFYVGMKWVIVCIYLLLDVKYKSSFIISLDVNACS